MKLRYFAGLSVEEAGQVLGISRATAARYWDFARSGSSANFAIEPEGQLPK